MDENRIGTWGVGKTPTAWPEFDSNGRPYNRGGESTLNIPGGRFVVLPRPHTSLDVERVWLALGLTNEGSSKPLDEAAREGLREEMGLTVEVNEPFGVYDSFEEDSDDDQS